MEGRKWDYIMYELVQVRGGSFYIQSPANIGVIKTGEQEVCLIDSGSDEDAGRKVWQILDQNQWKLTAIYITHSSTRHIGGIKYLQGQAGCKIYAPGIEGDFTNHPILNSAFLHEGFPTKEQKSNVQALSPEVLPEGMKAAVFVPFHAEETEDIVPLAQANIDKVYQIGEKIVSICKEPASDETILQKLWQEYSFNINFEQYMWVKGTIYSYLSWLMYEGRLKALGEDNELLWKG